MGGRGKLLVALSAMLGVLLVAVLATRAAWQSSLETRLVVSAEQLLAKSGEMVEIDVRTARQMLRLLAVPGYLDGDAPAEIQRKLDYLGRQSSHFEAFYFISLAGEVLPARGRSFSVADRDYFPRIVAGLEVIGEPIISRDTDSPILLITVPLYAQDSTLIGALAGAMVLSEIVDRAMLGLAERGGVLAIFDGQGRLLGANLNEGGALLEAPKAAQAPMAHAMAQMLGNSAPSLTSGVRHVERMVGDKPFEMFHSRLNDFGWHLVFAQPEVDWYAPIRPADTPSLLILAMALLLMVGLIVFIERLTVRPVRGLIEAMQHVEAGDYSAYAKHDRQDEFSEVVQAFNRMVTVLASARRQQKTIFDAFPYPIIVNRLQDGIYLDVNPAFEAFCGHPSAEILGQPLGVMTDALDGDELNRLLDRLKTEGTLSGMTLRVRHPEGGQGWVLYSARQIELNGEPAILTVIVDVSALKQAEAALLESQASLQAMFQQAPIPMSYSPFDESVVESYWNEAWYVAFGYPPSSVEGKGGGLFGFWRDPRVRLEFMRRLTEEGLVTCLEADLMRADGTPRTCEVYGRFIDVSGRKIVLTSYLDITDRRQAEEEMAISRGQLLANLENTPAVAIQWYDGAGRILYWNPASETMYGYAASEMVGGLPCGTFLDEAAFATFLQVLKEVRDTGRPVGPYEILVRSRDGHERWVLATTFSIPMKDGEMGFVCMDVDITVQKAAEKALQDLNATLEARVAARTAELAGKNQELAATTCRLEEANASTALALENLRTAQAELVRSEKMAGLGALVAGIAHELNTPIGNALMVASTLSDTQRSFVGQLAGPMKRSALQGFSDMVGESCAIMLRNLERSAELVSSFKQVAVDQSSYQRRPFELAEVVDEIALALSPTLRRSHVTLVVEVAAGLKLDSFPGPLGQVLMNLINNALLHAFSEGDAGEIRVVGQAAENERVELRVSDNGGGIPSEHLPKIFDPFFTTRLGQGGSGLGLSVVYNLVTDLLGGQISVESVVGQGTAFRVLVPLVAPARREVPD